MSAAAAASTSPGEYDTLIRASVLRYASVPCDQLLARIESAIYPTTDQDVLNEHESEPASREHGNGKSMDDVPKIQQGSKTLDEDISLISLDPSAGYVAMGVEKEKSNQQSAKLGVNASDVGGKVAIPATALEQSQEIPIAKKQQSANVIASQPHAQKQSKMPNAPLPIESATGAGPPGFLFLCSNNNETECLTKQIFGLPQNMLRFVSFVYDIYCVCESVLFVCLVFAASLKEQGGTR